MLQTKAYLTIVIYDRKTFIPHATGVIKLFTDVIKSMKKCHQLAMLKTLWSRSLRPY
jgi:hypothetical protein